MDNCSKLDNCSKVQALRSREWAGDWQFADAVRQTCSQCGDYQPARPPVCMGANRVKGIKNAQD